MMGEPCGISMRGVGNEHGGPVDYYVVELEKGWPYVELYRSQDERDAKLFLAQCLIYRDMIRGVLHGQ